MVLGYSSSIGFGRTPLDWRAAIVDVLVHASLILWLLSAGWSRPDLPITASMVLVHLWEPPLAQQLPQRPAATPVVRRPAAPHRSVAASPRRTADRQPRQSVVAPAASAPIEVGRESQDATAASLSGDAAQASLALRGNGTYTGPRFRSPRVKQRVIPDYPAAAFRAGQEGSVDVVVTIAADGRPVDARVHRSSGTPSLDDASVAAALAYTYRPGERYGVPVEAQGVVTIDWKIGARTIEHVGAGPVAATREEEKKYLDCLGDNSHDVALRRSASLCGPVQRRR